MQTQPLPASILPGSLPGEPLPGVKIHALHAHHDSRGWLMELHRSDDPHALPLPAMTYASITEPGVTRGPHEHQHQTDRFCFFGPSDFLVVLWDNRPDSPTYRQRLDLTVGQSRPTAIIVPPGVVHAYRNLGSQPGLILNLPDQLYRGPGRNQQVDEIRHELDPRSPFQIDS